MTKSSLFALSMAVVLSVAFLVYMRKTTPDVYRPGTWAEADTATNQAKHLYQIEKDRGSDLSNGPCLSNALLPGWVADIVHNPRQAVDNMSQNQCSSFLEGQAKHFVELDLNGNIVRVK